MSLDCAANLVGRLYKFSAGILAYVKEKLYNMTAEGVVQDDGKRFLEVSYRYEAVAVQARGKAKVANIALGAVLQ